MSRGNTVIDCYEIGNVYTPILYKIKSKKKAFDSNWLAALKVIKEWSND